MAGTNLGTAYVTIMPSAKGISGSISNALNGEATSAGKLAGNNIVKAVTGVIAGAGIATAFKQALDAGGALQQSFGGIETIYEDAAKGMQDMAYQAAQAGISANSYAEQAVSFGASLRQAFGGDMTKAAEAANTAILDMADNSAKMGTDISAIQNAYQGFAKANYTMLDNLKLGYGGTKTEMERLLKDAQALTGVEYNIDNLGDVYAAIHAIQGELNITGVAAAEAEGTFSGSANAMKAALENLKADLALGNDITNDLHAVMQTASNFFQKNLLPMIGNILSGIPSMVGEILTNAFNSLPGAVDSAIEFLNGLTEGLETNSGVFFEGLSTLWEAAKNALLNTDWLSLGGSIINFLWEGIKTVAPAIWEGIKNIASQAAEWFKSVDWPEVGHTVITVIGNAIGSLGRLIWDGLASIGNTAKEYFKNVNWAEAGANAFHALVDGISNIASTLWEAITTIGTTAAEHFKGIDWGQVGHDVLTAIANGFTAIGSFLYEAISTVGTNAMNFFQNVDWENAGSNAVKFIINGIKNLGSTIWDALKSIGETAGQTFQNIDWRTVGTNIINFIATGIRSVGSFIWGALKEIGSSALGAITSLNWVQQGIDIINGIISGIKQFGSQIGDTILGFASDALTKVKNFFKIGSPSKLFRDEVGKWIPLGIAAGIESQADAVTKAIDGIATDAIVGINPVVSNYQAAEAAGATVVNNTFNVYDVNDPEAFTQYVMQQLNLEMRIA